MKKSPQTETEFQLRRDRLASRLPELRCDAFFTSALPNVRYLSGFTGSNAALLVAVGKATLFTDPRYQVQATRESDCEVKIATRPVLSDVCKVLTRRKYKTIGIERNRISFEEYEQLKSFSPRIRLKALSDVVETLRMVKSPAEIATIKASVLLNSEALERSLKQFKASMTETDLAAEIDYRMRLLGADGTAFDTIVASGERTALPHAHPTEQAILGNQLLLVDMGATVAGYASDMTRTHALGKLSTKVRRMYRAVLESQLAAIDAVKPGVSCSRVDGAAREILGRYGLDKLFIHSTGHGLGLEIHEPPRVGRREKTKLQTGMVITIEPGAYLEGLGGIRIEDTVVVTSHGCEILTPTGKELVVL